MAAAWQNVKKSQVGSICNFLKKLFEIFNFDLKYLKNVPLKNFCDFWLNKPSRGQRTQVWPKTGTRSSFRCRFGGKKRIFRFFWGFLVPVAMGLGGRYLDP